MNAILAPQSTGQIDGSGQAESSGVNDRADATIYQRTILVHLDAGYNLARWILGDEHLASDALQDAALKAWRRFESFSGGDAKSWFLAIVRTSSVDLARNRHPAVPYDPDAADTARSIPDDSPLFAVLRREHAGEINEAVWSLPDHLREILVLREIEGLSYAQIAGVLNVPVGTVMSRISRARDAAAAALRARLTKERPDGV